MPMYGILLSHLHYGILLSPCFLELLDKLEKRICRTVGPSLAASHEPLAHHQNVASLFYRHYFGRCSLELAQLVPLPFSRGRSTRYSDRLHDFSVTIPRYYKDVNVNSFAKLCNSLPIAILCLTRVLMHLCCFTKIISDNAFFFCFIYFSLIRGHHSNSSHHTDFLLWTGLLFLSRLFYFTVWSLMFIFVWKTTSS